MITDQLENLFGKSPQFNETIAQQMKELILTDIDLCSGGKEQYHSAAGFAFLIALVESLLNR